MTLEAPKANSVPSIKRTRSSCASARRQNMDRIGVAPKTFVGEEKPRRKRERGRWRLERERERHDLRAQSVLHSAATAAALNDSFAAVVVIRLFCMNNNTDPMRERRERARAALKSGNATPQMGSIRSSIGDRTSYAHTKRSHARTLTFLFSHALPSLTGRPDSMERKRN